MTLVKNTQQLFVACLILPLVLLTSCNTASQPNWAAESAAMSNLALAEFNKRIFKFKPFNTFDAKLNLEMIHVANDGTLVLRSANGLETVTLGENTKLGSNVLKLVNSDPIAQSAVLESWPRY